MKLIKHWMLCAALAVCAVGASAQNGQRPDGPPPDGKPPGPPPEAIAACKGKAEGAKAEFKGRRGETVKGTCKKLREAFAVLPDGAPPPPPPQDRK
ncbi:hypothetical protein SAMN05216319_3281 [Duganella sp. CF402]|uniref:hypothetical protein n=1 Tax=unclassified Duganella TaxID=2636909 RepID=UPI0008AF38A6|nr:MULTISPECIES: hypothetical protein [unclassified Duganella]RZT08305.1 hypothetical protein EV582_0337 [Duganella sp. BK701]SEL98740.1 hypothetical protein SAMN05216319_3281 [Duganella sp. CF402]